MHNWQYVLFYNDNHNNKYKKLHCRNSTVLRVCTELFFLLLIPSLAGWAVACKGHSFL